MNRDLFLSWANTLKADGYIREFVLVDSIDKNKDGVHIRNIADFNISMRDNSQAYFCISASNINQVYSELMQKVLLFLEGIED